MTTHHSPDGSSGADFGKARILPELVFDAPGGAVPGGGHGTAEFVKAVILPVLEFDTSDPADRDPDFTPGPARRPPAAFADLAGSVAAALAAVPPEGRRTALESFLGAARTRIAAFDPTAASLLGGYPGGG